MKMTRKIVAVILAALMTAACIAGCGGSSSGSEPATSETQAKTAVKTINDGYLTVGMEIGYPPFESFADDGTTPIGLDVDIAKEIAAKLGLEAKFINTSFDGILKGIGTNYDCVISAVTINEERKETCLFSDPYIDNYQSIVIKKGSDAKYESLNDLDGKSIAIQKETTSDELLDDMIGKGTITCKKVAQEQVTTCFTQLANGEVDTVLCDSSVAEGYVARNPEAYEIAFQDKTSPEQFGVAMSKSDTELQKVVNEALAEMEKNGTLQDLRNKWFGAED